MLFLSPQFDDVTEETMQKWIWWGEQTTTTAAAIATAAVVTAEGKKYAHHIIPFNYLFKQLKESDN